MRSVLKSFLMNDMRHVNEMQHGLLEQNTRFKHSSVIFTNILLAN